MLNENQSLAVNHMDGPALILAGPGSGKTTVLVERILNLIKNGVSPFNILVITFTRDAAFEMKERFLKKAGSNAWDVTFGTFHSVFYRIVKDHIECKNYDDILTNTKKLLEERPDVRKHWQDRFTYFLIDEFQDINEIQFDIMKLLLSGKNNLFAVGDDDQSIYAFRGSSPKIMLDFKKHFPDARLIELDKNYRSSRKIVEGAKALIANNKERYFKKYTAESPDEGEVETLRFKDAFSEAKYIAGLCTDGRDSAILYRNRNLAGFVYGELRRRGLSVYSDEPIKMPSSSEVYHDIKTYLRIGLRGKAEKEELTRLIDKPDPKHLDFMKGLSLPASVIFIKKGLGYDNYLKNRYRKDAEKKEEAIALSDSFIDYAKGFESVRDLLNAEEDTEVKRPLYEGQSVSLHTFHGSKGLEFERVFILDAVEGVTPSRNAECSEDLEEERRMFYVAMTRAKKSLYVCVIEKKGEHKAYPSRFVSEMQNLPM